MDYQSYFKNKKITLMGLGALGRGVGDARFLAECGAEVLVTDRKPAEELEGSVAELEEYSNIRFSLGGHRKEDFQTADLVIKSAGVPYNSPYLKAARKNGVPIKMSTALFAKFSTSRLIGVTGTRGKSTITHLLEYVLKTAGLAVFVGGNVRGVSTLAHLPNSTPEELSLLELDSWQLQGFGEEEISPSVAVFATFMNDHLNYYKGDMSRYLKDKAHIFRHQSSEDTLILGRQCAELVQDQYPGIKSKVEVVGAGDLPADWQLKLLGEHNRYNAALARAAALVLEVEEGVIKEAVESFSGVPGRLEYLGQKRGIHYYNDNNSTTPDATLAALQALKDFKSRIILIAGGADKELDYTKLARELPDYIKELVLLEGEASQKLKQALPAGVESKMAESLERAVELAQTAAEPEEVILFSPAASSFNMFRHEYDRNDRFVELVGNLE